MNKDHRSFNLFYQSLSYSPDWQCGVSMLSWRCPDYGLGDEINSSLIGTKWTDIFIYLYSLIALFVDTKIEKPEDHSQIMRRKKYGKRGQKI